MTGFKRGLSAKSFIESGALAGSMEDPLPRPLPEPLVGVCVLEWLYGEGENPPPRFPFPRGVLCALLEPLPPLGVPPRGEE
jgi:hypothetical protein